MGNSKKIKIGIIGTGSIANEHINAYLQNEYCELYAFCDINEPRLNAMGEKYGVKRLYIDMNEMVKIKEIDAVSICTWNSAHAPCTIAALNAGKHVLCEKPMAINTTEAMAMKQAAEKNNKLLMIGFVRRFGNDIKLLKDFLTNDFFGELYYAKVSILRKHGNPGGWFGEKSRSGGGALIDLGVHVIDFARYLVGNPKPVSVYGVTFQKLYNRKNIKQEVGYSSVSKNENDICDVEDMVTALIRFDNGFALSVETSFSLNIKKDVGKIEFLGTKSGAKLNPELEIYSEINGYMADINLTGETALDFKQIFKNEINHFISCIVNGSECMSPAVDGVEIMEIIDAIYESASTEHEIKLYKELRNDF